MRGHLEVGGSAISPIYSRFAYSAKNSFLTLSQEYAFKQLDLAFSTTEVMGCFFYFAQALNWRISTLGLLLFISYARQLHYSFCAFSICTTSLEAAKLICPELVSFVTYFEGTWLVGNELPEKLIPMYINRNKHTQKF